MTSHVIAHQDDLATLKSFLQENRLPVADISGNTGQFVLYRGDDGNMIGTGGLEYYGNYALLRSVAVAPGFRGHHYGQAIVDDLMQRAKASNVRAVYLLTETAKPFFEKLGFNVSTREQAPPEIQASTEFSTVCPVSATLMCMTDLRH